MIIIDLNQVMLSNMMASIGNHTNIKVDTNLFRHMVLNTIRSINTKFKNEYGEIVIACDDKNYWRKKFFPYYKANRKKARDASELDWAAIFEALNLVRQELKDSFPYRVIQVDAAEADDVIATLCHEFGVKNNGGMVLGSVEKILIISGDKDFQQLQKYSNVSQFDPVRKRWIDCKDPQAFLIEHIFKGDTGDGVPNILSKGDTFVAAGRQKPLTSKRTEELQSMISFNDGQMFFITENEGLTANWIRNRTLIDLDFVPQEIKEAVLNKYNEQGGKDRNKLFNYFVEHRLRNLLPSLQEF